jgi:CubicO group peptidase (beta-lactamase class C family)
VKDFEFEPMAITVRDGQVVLARGYGMRDVARGLPVTSRTVMAIGSNSKSFTAALLAMLAEEGKLDWDRPVREYLPDFQLYDAFAAAEMTPRDLVTHRSGLPRHDLLWYGRSFTREELYQRLRHLPPTASFRSRYQYQNLMFMTAGYLAERITGRAWDDLTRERFFAPLGMTRSGTTVADLEQADDHALPYGMRGDSVVRIPYRRISSVGPAGSIVSSVDDMLRYVQFRIDRGRVGERRLLSEESEAELQSPQMVSGGEPQHAELGHTQYWLGLGISTYRGRKTVSHGGGIDGFISAMSWMPAERIGVVVLTNLSGNNPVPTLVVRQLFDRLLGLDRIDWVARQRTADAEARTRQQREREKRQAERREGTRPRLPLADYAGGYEHPGYGRFVVAVAGDALTASLEPLEMRLRHFHFDVWEIESEGTVVPLSGRVQFRLDAAGAVAAALVPVEQALPPLEFRLVR